MLLKHESLVEERIITAEKKDTVTLKDIQEARNTLKGWILHTPLQLDYALSEKTGAQVYLKLECFQPTRVFKIRGALNKILSLSKDERKRGVITASSGNHGLSVAYGAMLFGMKATICIPEKANLEKVMSIKRCGAKVVRHGKIYDETYNKALQIQTQTKAGFVHAFDDPLVISGQGTIGLEIMEDLERFDTLIIPIGGGGLISGVAVAIKSLRPDVKIIGVQSKGVPAMYESWKHGKILSVERGGTIADGLAAKKPGYLTVQLARRYVDDIFLVSDEEMVKAMITLLRYSRILAEPAGAAALAALLYKYRPKLRERIILIVSGGNISVDLLTKILVESSSTIA